MKKITKKQSKEFIKVATKLILEHGEQIEDFLDTHPQFIVETSLGKLKLWIDTNCDHFLSVFSQFQELKHMRENWSRYPDKNINKHTGKMNFHGFEMNIVITELDVTLNCLTL